jgi:hypothetical protein
VNRIFRAEDGAELREEDVRALADAAKYAITIEETRAAVKARDRMLMALAPKPAPTCEATLVVHVWSPNPLEDRYVTLPCVLPPGHHPCPAFLDEHDCCRQCGKGPAHENHAPCHMTASETWREP